MLPKRQRVKKKNTRTHTQKDKKYRKHTSTPKVKHDIRMIYP